MKLQIKCQANSEGHTITLTEGTSGLSGGLIGLGQANSIYTGIYDAVSAVFQNAGVLTSGNSLPDFDASRYKM